MGSGGGGGGSLKQSAEPKTSGAHIPQHFTITSQA